MPLPRIRKPLSKLERRRQKSLERHQAWRILRALQGVPDKRAQARDWWGPGAQWSSTPSDKWALTAPRDKMAPDRENQTLFEQWQAAKRRARDADAAALASGALTRQELAAKNVFLSASRFDIDFDSAVPLR